MSSENDLAAWLRGQVETDLSRYRAAADLLKRQPGRGPFVAVPYELGVAERVNLAEAQSRVADCEAKLAITDRCAALLPPDPADLAEGYQDGRDDDEIMRDEALAELAGDVLALLAGGYRHRPGYREEDWRP